MAKTFTKFRSDLDEDILSLLEDDDETELKVQAKTPGVAASLPTDEDELEDDDYAEWETVDAIPQTYVRGKNGTVTHSDEGVGQKGAEIPEAEMAEDLDEGKTIGDLRRERERRLRDPAGDPLSSTRGPTQASVDNAAKAKSGGMSPQEAAAKRALITRRQNSEYTPDNHGEALDETDSLHPDDLKRVNKTHPGSPQSRAKTQAEYDAPRTKGDVGDDINRAKEIKRLKAARRARELASDYTPDHGEALDEFDERLYGDASNEADRINRENKARKKREAAAAAAKGQQNSEYTPDHGEALGEEETINEIGDTKRGRQGLANYIQKAIGDIGINNRVKGHRGGVSRGLEMTLGKTAPKGPSNKRINRELLNRNVGVDRALKRLLKQGDEILDHDETFAEANEVIFTKKEKKAAAKRAKKNRKIRKDKRKANAEPDDSDYDNPEKLGHKKGYWTGQEEDYRPSFREFRDSFKEEPVYENVMDSLKKIVSRNQKSSLTFEDGSNASLDPRSAANILKVYGALNKSNQPKMADMLSKNSAGFSKALDFATNQATSSEFAKPGKITTLEP